MKYVTVLKTGPEYKEQHVHLLVESLVKYNKNVRLSVLSDININHPKVDTIPLIENWPGWWSKIEMFRPGLFDETVFYMDLDSVVVGDLSNLENRPLRAFGMISDVYNIGRFGSGLMMFDPKQNYGYLYDEFKKNSQHIINTYRVPGKWGDQDFINDNLQERQVALDQVYPGYFSSYKVHCRRGVPRNTKIVFFHGKPRPWEVKLTWR